jgi:hypothetical protein
VNFAVGIRVAGVALTALVAGCSTDTGGHAAHSAAHSPSAPAASAASGQRGPKTGSDTARPEVALPVVQCGNHLRMALIMTDPAQPVQAQVATFTTAAEPAPPWEVAAFRNVVTRFSSVVAKNGRHAALQRPAFAYPALLQLCSQSAAE